MLPTYKEYKIQRMIGKSIRSERKSLGLSINKVAKLSGISNVHINNIELGYENPTIATLEKIAKIFKKKVEVKII